MSDNTQFSSSSRPDIRVDQVKRPCLVMIKGDYLGEVYELVNDVTMLGRSDDVDLVVSDVSISRRHAMIVNRVEGIHVSDLGSTNGTFVNRKPVTSPLKLNEGDKLTLGVITFKFSYQDEDDTEYHLMLRNMAIKDGLTRVYNKRFFMDALGKEFDYNRRNRSGLGLVMFDIDHFKEINDTYGHPVGDHILKELARLVEHEARGYDVFARYGGEEFVFLMRGGSRTSAQALAERVHRAIEEHTFTCENIELEVTVSVGASFWGGEDTLQRPAELVELTDKLLYEAKAGGRNCIRYDSRA